MRRCLQKVVEVGSKMRYNFKKHKGGSEMKCVKKACLFVAVSVLLATIVIGFEVSKVIAKKKEERKSRN